MYLYKLIRMFQFDYSASGIYICQTSDKKKGEDIIIRYKFQIWNIQTFEVVTSLLSTKYFYALDNLTILKKMTELLKRLLNFVMVTATTTFDTKNTIISLCNETLSGVEKTQSPINQKRIFKKKNAQKSILINIFFIKK